MDIHNTTSKKGASPSMLNKLESLEELGHFALPYEVMKAYDNANTQITEKVFSEAVLEQAMFSKNGWRLKKFKPRVSETGGYYVPTCSEGLLTYLGKGAGCDTYLHMLLAHRLLMFDLHLQSIK